MQLKPDPHQLEVYHEGRKRKIFVGSLEHNAKDGSYIFTYDMKYMRLKTAISIGPELPLTQVIHKSEKIFPSLYDRIPSKDNPAYKDYCKSCGINPTETNLIKLLTTIGRRGPSTFVFETVTLFNLQDLVVELKAFRERHHLSLWEYSVAFDVPYLTMKRIENGKCKDMLTMRLVALFLTLPEAALWQLQLSGGRIKAETLIRLKEVET